MYVKRNRAALRRLCVRGLAIAAPLLLGFTMVTPLARADAVTYGPVTATVTAFANGDTFYPLPGASGQDACDGGNSDSPYGHFITDLNAGDTIAGIMSMAFTQTTVYGDGFGLLFIADSQYTAYDGTELGVGGVSSPGRSGATYAESSFSFTAPVSGAVYGCVNSGLGAAPDGNPDAVVGTVNAEITAGVAPTVYAGPDQTVHGTTATLSGSASSPTGVSGTTWAQLSGPGTASFSSGSALQTSATVTDPGVYVFQLTAVGDNGLTASSDVQVTFLDTLNVTVVLSDVPIRPDPGTGAQEEATITVTDPDGSPAAGADVTLSTAPHVVLRTNAHGQATLLIPVTTADATATITATSHGLTATTTTVLRDILPESCTVNGYVVSIPQITLDLMLPDARVPNFISALSHAIDVLGKGLTLSQAYRIPATTVYTQYVITVPGASDIYVTESVLSDENGRRTDTIGPYYSRQEAHPDPSVCVLTVTG
jgi:hypothetical protein